MVGDCDTFGAETGGSIAFASPKSSTFACRLADFDICGLQIAVDDPLLVCRFEGFGDLFGNRHRLVNWNRSLRDAVGQTLALHHLHDEGRHAIRSSIE